MASRTIHANIYTIHVTYSCTLHFSFHFCLFSFLFHRLILNMLSCSVLSSRSRTHCIKTLLYYSLMFAAGLSFSFTFFTIFLPSSGLFTFTRHTIVILIALILSDGHSQSQTGEKNDMEYNSFWFWSVSRRYLCHFVHEI